MSKKKLILAVCLLAVSMVIFLVGGYYYMQKQVMIPANSAGGDRLVIIGEGESVDMIANDLAGQGIIKNAFYLKFYLTDRKLAHKIQAGKYILSSRITIPEIANYIVSGKAVTDDVRITIPEGFTAADIDARLAEAGLIKPGELLALHASTFSVYEFLKDKPAAAGLEGYFFPDTYRFSKNISPQEIADKMLENFDKKFDSGLRQDLENNKYAFKGNKPMTVFDTVVLASIIQKEVQDPEDMKKVAGIFYNRLNLGMNLEADSTLAYVTGSHRDRASYADLENDSPYNTYKFKGLPPGPISNPGLEAISAAIHSEMTDYYYFLTTGDGQVVYSKTYVEHLKNKIKWLK